MKEKRISELPNLSTALLLAAEKWWNKTGPIYFGRKFRYESVIARVREYAAMLVSLGVKPGENGKPSDCVATMMTNVPQSIFSNFGTVLAGGIADPINLLNLPQNYKPMPDLKLPEKTIKQIRYQIKDSEPKVLIALDIFYPVIAQILDELEKTKTKIVLTRIQDYLPRVPIIAQRKYRKKAKEKEIWVEKKDIPFDADFTEDWFSLFGKKENTFTVQPYQPWEEFPGAHSKPDDTAVLLYTAGTEGLPKGVELTNHNLLSLVRQCREHMGDSIKDEYTSMLAILPFFHVFGLTTGVNIPLLSIGAPTVLVPDSKDVETWVGWIPKHKIKAAAFVSKIFERLAKKRPDLVTRKNLESIELFINGGGALSKDTRTEFESLLGDSITIFEGYGKTEAPVISVCTLDDFKPGSAGKPLPDTEIKIIDLDTGEEISPGTKEGDDYKTGEIIVKGPQVAKGYWNKPEKTAEVFKDGWHCTEDIGHFDKDGHLFITDRKGDMGKNLGEKVYPTQIEDSLPLHPYIEKIRMVCVEDDRLVAVVVLSEEGERNKETVVREFLEFAKQNLPRHEVPREIFILPDLDEYTNNLGKPLRKKIREDILKGVLK